MSCDVLQMDQEECSCSVETEGSTEAACWASLFRQRPERGETSPRIYFVFYFQLTFIQFDCMSLLSLFILQDLLSVFFILTLLLPSCLFSPPPLWPLLTVSFCFSIFLALTLTRSQHVECLYPELQLLLFLDYYWLSQSFKPCLKSVTVDVVCVVSLWVL